MPDSRRLMAYLIPYVVMTTFQYQFVKAGLAYADPLTFMCLRYLIAGACCFVLARGFKPILNRDMALLSVFTFISSALWAYGLVYVSAAQSAVLNYTMPLFAIPLSIVLLREHAAGAVWAGALVGFVGVAIYSLALTSAGGSLLGALLSVGNAFFWALYSVYYRRLKHQDPVRTVATQFSIGGLLYIPFIPFTFHLDPSPAFFIDLGYVSIFGGVLALVIWNLLIRMDTIGKITTLVFAVPVLSVIVQAVLSDQLPTPLSIVGVGVIFSGIYISRLRFARQPVATAIDAHASTNTD
jgi:drug/metabolite transporter (DMT)-like permease